MNADFLWSLVTTYGPLALGWPVAAFFMIHYVRLAAKTLTRLEENTKVMSEWCIKLEVLLGKY